MPLTADGRSSAFEGGGKGVEDGGKGFESRGKGVESGGSAFDSGERKNTGILRRQGDFLSALFAYMM